MQYILFYNRTKLHLHCLFGCLIKSVTGSDNFVHFFSKETKENWFALPYSQPDVLFSQVLQRCNQPCNVDWQMHYSSYRWNFDLDKKNKTITIAGKSIFKLVKFESLVVNCLKWGKYSPVKFTNFLYICITHGINNHFWAETGYFYHT